MDKIDEVFAHLTPEKAEAAAIKQANRWKTPRVDEKATFVVLDGKGHHIVEADDARIIEQQLNEALVVLQQCKEAITAIRNFKPDGCECEACEEVALAEAAADKLLAAHKEKSTNCPKCNQPISAHALEYIPDVVGMSPFFRCPPPTVV